MKSVIKPILLPLLLVILLAGMVGACTNDNPPELTTDELQQILADSHTAMMEANSYAFLMDMNMSANVTSEEESGDITALISGDGAMDMETMNMKMIMNMSIAMDMGFMDMSMEDILMEMYKMDDWVYTHFAMEDMGDEWMKMQATPESTEMMDMFGPDMIEQYMGLWNSTIDLELLRMETLNDVECYVIKVLPDAQAIMDLLENQSLPIGEMPIEELPGEALPAMEKLFDEMEYLVWIGKDTGYTYKMTMDLNMDLAALMAEMEPEEIPEGSMTMLMNMSMTMSDFNEPVSITLPPEAVDAPEVSPEENPFM